MSYVVECLETRLIAESVALAGITFQNNVIITNNSTLVTDGTVTINDNTPATILPTAGALIVTGGVNINSGNGALADAINVNGGKIRNGPTDLADFAQSDFITRSAAETLASGLNVFPSTKFATIAPINTLVAPTTGANVITSLANQTINSQIGVLWDAGVSPIIVTDRVLVKNDNRTATFPEPDDIINGIYEVTDIGSAGSPWVLTRVSNFEVGDNAYQAYTLITEGATQQGGYIQCNSANPTVVGTDSICFSLFSASGGQNLESVLNTGNLTGANTIEIGTGSGGITSTAGTNLGISAGTDDLLLSGDEVVITSTANTILNAVNITTVATGNLLDTVTGTSTTNANGIVLASTAVLTASGTTASVTASTGDLTLTSTAGTVNINDAVGGVSIDTGTNTITVNTGDVVITAPLPQDVVGALNALQASVLLAAKQRVSYQLMTIPLKSLPNFPTVKPIYWTWNQLRYGNTLPGMGYNTPVLVFEVVTIGAHGNGLDIHVRDTTTPADMLTTTTFASSTAGVFYAQTLSNIPSIDAEIYIEIKSQVPGNKCELRGVSLEWIADNPV